MSFGLVGVKSRRPRSVAGLRTYCYFVLYGRYAFDIARKLSGPGFFFAVLGETREHYGAFQCLYGDTGRINRFAFDELAFDLGGDGRIVDIRADGLLIAFDCAASAETEDQSRQGDEKGMTIFHDYPRVRVLVLGLHDLFIQPAGFTVM